MAVLFVSIAIISVLLTYIFMLEKQRVLVSPSNASVAATPLTADQAVAVRALEDYKTLVGASWQLLAQTTKEYNELAHKLSDPKNAKTKRDKLKEIQLVAKTQVGQLQTTKRQLESFKVPAGYEQFHATLSNAVKDCIDHFAAAVELCGNVHAHSHLQLSTTATGANADFKSCQTDARMAAVLQPPFNANILSEAADKVIGIHDSAVAVVPTPTKVVYVNNYSNPGPPPMGLPVPQIPAPSAYKPQMQALLNQYLDSRTDMQKWCNLVRSNSGNPTAFDPILARCIQTRQAILSQMQGLAPDAEYAQVHSFCIQILQAAVTGCQSAAQSRNPNDPGLRQVSDFINRYQADIARVYGIRL